MKGRGGGGGRPDPGDIQTVASFLAWQEPRALCGGSRAEEALAAYGRIIGIPGDKLRKVARGEGEG